MAMKEYKLRMREVDRDIFNFIKNGKKKVETRAVTERYRDIKQGDILIFICGKNKIERQVKRARIFKSLEAMLKKYKVKDINPKLFTSEELKKMYYGFPGYKEKIKKFGLIALELE